MNRLTRISAILGKEVKQLARDRLTFGMIVGIPLIQLMLFGYAINTDVRYLRAIVVDQSDSHLSRTFISQLGQTQVLDIRRRTSNLHELEDGIRRGEYVVGISIPADFDRRVQRGDRAFAQLLVDGSDPTILGVAQQIAGMPVFFDTQTVPTERAGAFEIRPLYNPEGRSAIHIVPALLGVILTMTMVLFTAVAIVRERERGNLEFLINTPVTNAELMIGKIIPYIVIGLAQVCLLLAFAYLLFDVPMRGAFAHLFAAAFIFIAANLALGLTISTVASTQFQAMQMTFFFFLPSILLSGFMFPFDGMPAFARYIAEVLPLTHFVRLARGIMLRDASLLEMPVDVISLIAFFCVMLLIAVFRFKKRLD